MAIWIVEQQDGALTFHAAQPGTEGIALGKRRAQMPRALAQDGTEYWDWTAGAIATDVAKLKQVRLASVDATREAQREKKLTRAMMQSFVYRAKAQEVFDFTRVLNRVLTLLATPAARRARFPFAQAEAELTGDDISVVLARYEAGIAASVADLAQSEAVAVVAKRKIREAATAGAVDTAASVVWPIS